VTFTTAQASGSSELDLGTKHPKGVEGYRAIATFEAKGKLDDIEGKNYKLQGLNLGSNIYKMIFLISDSGVESGSAPNFVVNFNDVNLGESSESVNAYFEAQLEPKGDPGITLQWKLNGKELQDSKNDLKLAF
jgi:hypothetical protein